MSRNKLSGFTLLEMVLVIVIMSSIFLMGVNYYTQSLDIARRNKAAVQVQKILNAAMAYYQNNGNWGTTATPAAPETLTSASNIIASNFLPTSTATATGGPATPWGGPFYIAVNSTNNANTFQVSFLAPNASEAAIVAGRLPTAMVSGSNVIAQISVPTQVLNSARSISYASQYHSGACVPAPVCPPGMIPQISVTPTSVNGVYDQPSCTVADDPTTCTVSSSSSSAPNAYALTGFMATAIGDPNNSNQPLDVSAGNLASCSGSGTAQCEASENPTVAAACPSGTFANGFNYCCPTGWTVVAGNNCQFIAPPVYVIQISMLQVSSCPSGYSSHGPNSCCPNGWGGLSGGSICFTSNIQATTYTISAVPEISQTTINPTYITTGKYWRVCLAVVTEKGQVAPTFSAWGQLSGTIMAVTKCVPPSEPSGSDFTVFQ